MDETISLSFLELASSDFSIPIYCKPYQDNEQKEEDVYRYKLPNFLKDDFDEYAVSFSKKDNFSQRIVNSKDNRQLTKKWIIAKLCEKAKTVSPDSSFSGTHFIPNLSFVISTHNEGQCLIQLESYYLAIKNCYGFLIDYKFKPYPGYEKTRQEKVLSLSLNPDGTKNKNFYSDKLKFVNVFIQKTLPLLFPLIVDEVRIDIKNKLTDLTFSLLKEKTYVFQDGESKTQFQGIKQFHPLKNDVGNPLFVFIFESNKVNISRQLVRALRGQLYPTFSGMEKMFGIPFSNDHIRSISVENYSKENLSKIDDSLGQIMLDNPDSNIIGICTGIEKEFDLENDYSPYYYIKSSFLKHGFAIQMVTIDQALKKDGFKWSISGIALQLFVKLGGVPWEVKPQNDKCLIFGISSAHLQDVENNTIKKYFAYSLCFNSSGRYKKLSILGNSGNKDTYIKQFSEQLRLHLDEDVKNNGIKKCVIHIPYKLRQEEILCIRQVVDSIKEKNGNVKFSIIKINIVNKFFGYSHYNSNIPIAGSVVKLDAKEYLIWFEGLQQGKIQMVSPQNVSNPVNVKFIYSDNFTEDERISYLQDLINLSGANWRGFNAKHEPVSTLYPELVAKFAGKFDQYGIKLDIGKSAMEKVWFI